MPIHIKQLADIIEPIRTVLFFGAGSSIPSRAPTTDALIAHFAKRFKLPEVGFNLSETASLAEHRTSRGEVIAALRELIKKPKAHRRYS